tara:strand:- start:671 stop:1294 length:624 start_codon:yes stop_codon:yes gene_type:complete
MLKLNALFKSFGSKKVLRGVNLEVNSGEIVTLVGNNGSGKTTLLRTLTTLDSPDSYNVAEIDGFDLSSDSAEIRSRLGYLSHNSPFYPELTGVENLRLWLELNSISDADSKARTLLAQVGLISFCDELAGNYSRGMIQRLGFSMALSHSPTTLLLDEPFTGLDTEGTKIIEELLVKSKEEGCSIVIVSHDKHSYSDRTLKLERGEIV